MTEEPPLSKYEVEAKDIMDLLISRGASVALRGRYWHTALHAAARSRSLITARYLLKQKDVSRDEKDLMGRLPLHLAAMRGNWEMVEELSSGKSDLVSEDRQGRNVFHMAAALGHLTLLDTLLENVQKADELINKADIDGWTPLHWSCRSRSEEVVQLLLKNGASKTAVTAEEGWLPFHVAIYYGQNFSDKLKVDGASHDLKEAEYRVATCDCCQCVSAKHPLLITDTRDLTIVPRISSVPATSVSPSMCTVKTLIFVSSAIDMYLLFTSRTTISKK